MPIIYRAEKGAPLSSSEIDGNFKDLETRLKTLEETSEVGEGLGAIQIAGDQITFTGTFGTDFGTFALPKARGNPLGLWSSHTSYQKGDIVVFENALYRVSQDHMSSTWDQDQALWQEILSLPQPPSSSFSLYEKATLPEREILGKLAILVEAEEFSLIFFNGKTWQRLMKGETL